MNDDTPKANQLALRAFHEEKRAKATESEVKRAEWAAYVEESRRNGASLLEEAGVSDWFPGVVWELYDWRENHYGFMGFDVEYVYVPADRPVGTNPGLTTIILGIGRNRDGRVIVKFVRENTDSETHVTSWVGPVVKSAADVGKNLEARILQAGNGWLGKETVPMLY